VQRRKRRRKRKKKRTRKKRRKRKKVEEREKVCPSRAQPVQVLWKSVSLTSERKREKGERLVRKWNEEGQRNTKNPRKINKFMNPHNQIKHGRA
jgi:hypothetical protein